MTTLRFPRLGAAATCVGLAATLVVWTMMAAPCAAQIVRGPAIKEAVVERAAEDAVKVLVTKDIPVKAEEATDEQDDQTGIPCLILKPDGTPLADTEVAMFVTSQRTPDSSGTWQKTLRTDVNGRFFLKVAASKVWIEGLVDKVGAFVSDPIVVAKGAATAEQKLQLKTGGRVIGRVVDQASGQPLKDVTVSYQCDLPQGRRVRHAVSSEVTTDAEGRFTLERVPSDGQTAVIASLTGYQTARTQVAVAEGQAAENVEIKLTRLGVLRCRLLKSDGTPLAKAQVRVVSRWESERGDSRSTSGFDMATDDDGVVELKELRHGNVRLLFYATNVGYNCPESLQVAKGKEMAPITLTLKPLLAASGTAVEKQTGKAVAGVRIQLYPSYDSSEEPPAIDSTSGDIKSDADGRWTIGNLTPGRYQVGYSRDGYNSISTEIQVVEGKDLTDVKLELIGKVTLTGTITRRDTGEAVAKAKVACGGTEGVTDDQGKFSLQVTPNEGDMYLTVTADGLAVHSQQVAFPDFRAPAPLRIAMEPGGVINGQVIDQDARRPAADRKVTVASLTKCRKLKHFIDNRQMNELHEGYLHDGGQGGVLHATTDAQGGFTITTAPPDKYVAILFSEDAPPIVGEPFDLAAGGTIDVPAIQVTARPVGYVSGRLLGPDGKPLTEANAMFTVSDRNRTWSRSSQLRSGRYFVPLSATGVTRFYASVQGYGTVERTIRTPDRNVAVEEDLQMSPVKSDASVSGRVFLDDGTTPAAGVGVQLYVRNRPWFGNSYGSWQSNDQMVTLAEEPVLTQADGTFRISNLPPGTYGLIFEPRGKRRPWGGNDEKPEGGLAGYRMTRRDTVEVAESAQVADINATLQKSGAIAGQVLDAATGKPIAEAQVSAYSSGGREAGDGEDFWPWSQNTTVQTDENGKFLLDGLVAGSYYVQVWANGYASETSGFWGRKTVAVKVGETTQRTVRLKSR